MIDNDKRAIEEMASDIEQSGMLDCPSRCRIVAEELYFKGYRQQSGGEWVYHEYVSSYDGAKSGYSCSRCDAFVDENVFDTDEFHKEFCGNCGAKMKGVSYEQRKEN